MRPTMRTHIGEEEKLKQEIIELRSLIKKYRETHRYPSRKMIDNETLLKRKIERLEKIMSLRDNFKFENDLPERESDNPIEVLIRDKYKDENYKGYIKKEVACARINEMNIPDYITHNKNDEDYIFLTGGNAETE